MSTALAGGGMQIDRTLSVGNQVRQVFEQSGGRLQTPQLAALCHALQIDGFTDEDAQRAAMHSWTNQVRGYLKEKDERGMPFAGQAADGKRGEWVARRWWDVDTYRLNIGEYLQQRDENDRIAVSLGSECAERFGVDPYTEGR